MVDKPYLDDNDRRRHQHAIAALADRHHRPPQEIAGLYEPTLQRLRDGATVTDYLPMLLEKHVSAALRRRR